MLLLLVAALTMDVGFTLVGDCPTTIDIDAPIDIKPGASVPVSFAPDVPATVRYGVRSDDGAIVQAEKKATSTAKVIAPKHAGPEAIIITATATKEGCDEVSANATMRILRPSTNTMPRTTTIVPWVLAALATLLATVLIWRR